MMAESSPGATAANPRPRTMGISAAGKYRSVTWLIVTGVEGRLAPSVSSTPNESMEGRNGTWSAGAAVSTPGAAAVRSASSARKRERASGPW